MASGSVFAGHLGVGLLGELRLTLAGTAVRFSARPRVAPRFAYIPLYAPRAIPRDELAFGLWPDESENVARGNLRRHLLYLRTSVAGDANKRDPSQRRRFPSAGAVICYGAMLTEEPTGWPGGGCSAKRGLPPAGYLQ